MDNLWSDKGRVIWICICLNLFLNLQLFGSYDIDIYVSFDLYLYTKKLPVNKYLCQTFFFLEQIPGVGRCDWTTVFRALTSSTQVSFECSLLRCENRQHVSGFITVSSYLLLYSPVILLSSHSYLSRTLSHETISREMVKINQLVWRENLNRISKIKAMLVLGL